MEKNRLFIVEEHHEVFPVWNKCIAEGIIKPEGNVLLHVDQHADLDIPVLYSSMKMNDVSAGYTEDFTFNELSISNFIVPAIFKGIFNSVYWLNHDLSMEKMETDCFIFSLDGAKKILSLKKDAKDMRNELTDARNFTFRRVSIFDEIEDKAEIVLDIDLDFFSCNKTPLPYNELEITREEFEKFENKYHFLKLNPANKIKPIQRGGRYYLLFNDLDYEMESILKVTEDRILERIGFFKEFLIKNGIQPSLITIARSRYSNYTPEDQWEYIERNLMDMLNEFFLS